VAASSPAVKMAAASTDGMVKLAGGGFLMGTNSR
jgi:hypothetical protein